MPQVSIFIPIYNTERFITRTIESILSQTFQDWEIIALDDCSKDNSYQIIQGFAKQDNRIKVFRNEQNIGMMSNWNKGISLCSSKYFAKLDSDDFWHPSALEEAYKILEANEKIGLVCSKYVEVDENENPNYKSVKETPEFIVNNKFWPGHLVKLGPRRLFYSGISVQGVLLIRRSIFDQVGNYHPHFWGDQELWFRIGAHYDFYFIDKIYYYYRKWSGANTSVNIAPNPDKMQKDFFDCRSAIFSYYYQENKLTKKEYKEFMLDTTFLYNSYLIYKARIEKNYLEMFKTLVENTIIDSRRMFVENLHVNRLFKLK